MEKYHLTIKKRMICEAVLAIVLMPIAIFTAIMFYKMDAPISGSSILDFGGGFINGVRSALVSAFIIYLLITFVRDMKALKDEKILRQLFIAEHDERMINVNDNASKMSFNIILYLIIIAALATALFNTAISLTLFIVWTFIVIIRVVTTIIYNKKI